MRLSRPLTAAAVCLAGASIGNAQDVFFNEIFASHTGSDTEEYIELIGTPGKSLDGWMVVILDGDSFAAGILDRAWDLTGSVIPADGYFVMANSGNPAGDYDLALGPHNGGTQDNIENGSQTYYLLESTDVMFVQGLHNQDLDLDDDLVTTLAMFPGTITFHEIVGVWDEDGPQNGEQVFDGALELGPDLAGPFEPAGYFKPDDAPNCWCEDVWLDFFLFGITPGAMNPSSGCTLSTGCGGTMGGPIGTNYCGPAASNSTGQPGVISAFGTVDVADNFLDLTGDQLPNNQSAYFIISQTQGFVMPPGSQGFLCLAGAIGRHNSQVMNTGGAGSVTVSIDLLNLPYPGFPDVMSGDTWNWQLWYRDVGGTNNFTDGIEITFQ